MGEDKFGNDATLKLLGYDYQKIIALETCLNAKRNDFIWIECKGDVADSTMSKEIKHHIDPINITSNSVDVWKTIKNYVLEFDITEQFNLLILHTTSISQSDSIFYNWNNLSAEEKEKKVKAHTPSATVSEFHKAVLEFNRDNLLKILDKFKIIEGQPNIQEKWEELKEHPTFTIIPDNYRDVALMQLYGHITKKAIDNSNEWKISINDFKRDIQLYLSPYTKGNVPFQIIEECDLKFEKDAKKFAFIEKMEAINLKDKFQSNAIADYLRANLSQIKLLELTPTLSENFRIYDDNTKRFLEDEKGNQSVGISKDKLNTEEAHNVSKNLYFSCIGKKHDPIIGVDNTQKYYRDGRIHHTLEESDFEWKFKIEDL